MSTTPALAAEIVVAAASDLSFPIKEIIAEFEKQTGHTVKLTLGSSGNFQAQIVNGAPFDVYLSADIDYVRQLDQRGLVEPGTIYVYAVGRLVVWVPNGSTLDVEKLGIRTLVQPAARRIAIANPRWPRTAGPPWRPCGTTTSTTRFRPAWSSEKTSHRPHSSCLQVQQTSG